MQPEQKKARIQQITASQELKRSTPKIQLRWRIPGERQTLLHRRSKEFSTRRMKTVSVSSKEDASMTETGNDDTEPLQQPEVMIYGNTLNVIQYLHSK
uniref:Uncharacterized protein n=1 Tax=Aegilops tauschii subsp. strangulata TaxID=200361 RepID=A0A453ETC5_AEGTS